MKVRALSLNNILKKRNMNHLESLIIGGRKSLMILFNIMEDSLENFMGIFYNNKFVERMCFRIRQ